MQKDIHHNLKEHIHSFYKGKRVLVTGGCGFIGSHIAETLVGLGANVTILDNLETGRIENIAPFKDHVTFIHGSITHREVCMSAMQDVDVVFHLAAFISVPKSTLEPYECHDTNVNGTVNLLEAAKNAPKRPRFIFSSSAATYGNTEEPCSEHTPINPQSPYAWSKLFGEQYCKQYAQMGIKTACMRYFNVCGPRQNPHAAYAAAVAKFSYSMAHNEPITFFGDGLQTRDFVPVETVVEVNLLLGILPDEYLDGSVYNVATGRSINLFELFEMLKKKYPDYNQEIQFAPARPGDVKHAIADCAKLDALRAKLNAEYTL